MTIIGESQEGTIINGTDTNWIFNIQPGISVTLYNLTLTNGYKIDGGAIYNAGNLIVTNCTFNNNTATNNGGAIHNYDSAGNLIVTNCTFNNNTATNNGGAICNLCLNPLTCTITKSTFNNNTATYGGAIRNMCWGLLTCTITESTFNNNIATNNGGAINNFNDFSGLTCTITESTFNNNTATYGGAIFNYPEYSGLTCTITESTFNNNTATNNGGAICNWWGICTANFNRFYNNTAANGNAIYHNVASVDVEDNWWGSNNPISQFPNLIYGASAPTQWLYMTINVTPSTINNTETSLVTVSFNNYSSDGITYTEFDPSLGHIPDGTPVTFRLIGDILGSLDEPLTLTTTNGTASILFTASSAGVQQINATTDDQNVSVDIIINPASYVEITKEFMDLPWGEIITTAYYNDKIYAIVKVHNQGPDRTTSVNLLDLLNGLTWTGNYYVYRTPGSYPNTEDAWVLNDPEHPFNGTNWDVGSLSTMIGSSRWLAIEVIINKTGTVSNYAETVNQSTSPYRGYANYTAYLTADITPTIVTVDDIRGNKGDTVTLKAVLTDDQLNPLSGKTLEFWIDGVKVGENITDSTGTALFNYIITETPGNHALTALFSGDSQYQTSNATGELYVPSANLYIQITSNNNKPTVGEIFTLRYKLGNYGPDDALNVTITIPIPDGFVISKIEGDGNWTIVGNNIIWTMNNVTVGDPDLYVSGWTLWAGNFQFDASILSDTFNLNTQGVNPFSLNAAPQVNAASVTINTVGMQNTGTPIAGIVLAILMVLGGFINTKKNQ